LQRRQDMASYCKKNRVELLLHFLVYNRTVYTQHSPNKRWIRKQRPALACWLIHLYSWSNFCERRREARRGWRRRCFFSSTTHASATCHIVYLITSRYRTLKSRLGHCALCRYEV
jgi:hypothetical protein